jgi:hypothetical protein
MAAALLPAGHAVGIAALHLFGGQRVSRSSSYCSAPVSASASLGDSGTVPQTSN